MLQPKYLYSSWCLKGTHIPRNIQYHKQAVDASTIPEMIIEYLNIAAEQTSDEVPAKIIKAHQAVESNKPLEANTTDPVNYLTWSYLTNSVPKYFYQLMPAQTTLVSPVCATIFPVTSWS